LHNSTHIKSDVRKWLCFLKEQRISKPQENLETVAVIDSKDEDDLIFFKIEINNNLNSKLVIEPTIPLVVSGSSKPS
jgi:hypothetical protein